jgi:hypothetical protein
MPKPERLSADDVHPPGAKLKVRMSQNGDVEIIGNRLGLKALSNICDALSKSVAEPGNHFHFMDNEGFWGTEPGSLSLVIYGEDW